MKSTLITLFFLLVLVSCADDENKRTDLPKFTLKGEVTNVTSTSLVDVKVNIYKEGENTAIKTVFTDSIGQFSEILDEDNYSIEVIGNGYSNFIKNVSKDDNDRPINIRLLGEATVSGYILDSQTGLGLSNATLSFTRDGSLSRRSELAKPEFFTVTDNQGFYEVKNAPYGKFSILVEKEEFFSRSTTKTLEKGINEVAAITAVMQPAAGSLRVVLTWGEHPRDLDAHLTGPDSLGGRFHMYYKNKTPNLDVSLDVDDRTSFGPETTTIENFLPGVYRYSIDNFTHTASYDSLAAEIGNSPTSVEVYDENGLILSVTAPVFNGSAQVWRVFEIIATDDEVLLTPINEYYVIPKPSRNTGNGNNYRIKADKSIEFDIDDF